MPITQSENRNEVKKIKFHHRVKRFYHKNLFRKIYTVAIIGLIGANIFSMVKYQSFADELDVGNELEHSSAVEVQSTPENPSNLPANWQFGTITLVDQDEPEYAITIMDRNLGATTNDITDKGSYGWYYQYGRNYGFPGAALCEGIDDPDGNVYCPLDGYVAESLSIQGLDDITDAERFQNYDEEYSREDDAQGPCPDGWHVMGDELENIIRNYGKAANIEIHETFDCASIDFSCGSFGGFYYNEYTRDRFLDYFKLPLVGYRGGNYINNVGNAGYYRARYSYRYEITDFYIDNDRPSTDYGASVRCVSDSYENTNGYYTVTFYDENNNEPFTQYVAKNQRAIQPEAPEDDELSLDEPQNRRYIAGRYTSDGNEYDFSSPVTSDLNLYAEWVDAIRYEDGYIKVTDGNSEIWLKNGNQGVNPEEAEKFHQIYRLIKGENCLVNESIGGENYSCNEEGYAGASRILGVRINDMGDIEDYISEHIYGNYYFWGNNSYAQYDKWEENEEWENATGELGQIGLGEDTGWEEWSEKGNPCDPDEGEYLPTPDDWEELMTIWSNINGENHNSWYDISSIPDDRQTHGIMLNDFRKFAGDMLMPDAGYYKEGCIPDRSSSNTDCQRGVDREYNSYPSLLWTAKSDRGMFGVYNSYYGELSWTTEKDTIEYINNATAAPVRCFIDPDYLAEGNWYTVTFMDGDEELFTKQVKEGKTIKNVKEPTKDNYGFVGWYIDPELKNEFVMTTPITRNITLYAKWAPKGVFHKDGYIKVTDGKNTIYVSDKNVGVSDAAVNLLKFYQLTDKRTIECQNSSDNACRSRKYINGTGEINEILGTQYSDILEAETDIHSKVLEGLLTPEEMDFFTKYVVPGNNYFDVQCDLEGYPDNCYDDKWLDYVNGIMGNETEDFEEFDNTDDARAAIYDKYGDDVVDKGYWPMLDNQLNGNYYYRGNNNGVSYNDLKFEDPNDGRRITNIEDLEKSGFDGGKIGMEGEGWIEGNPNPCDASKGEYLPTPEDWKNLMEIWGNANDYGLEGGENGTYNYEGTDYPEYDYGLDMDGEGWSKWQSDLLLPWGSYIYEDMCRNEDTQQNIPCTRVNGSSYLRASQDEEGRVGVYDGGELYYAHYNARLYAEYQPDNTRAVPVRCFLNIEEPEDEDETPTTPVTPTPSTPSNGYSSGGRKGEKVKDMHNSADETNDEKSETDTQDSQQAEQTPANSSERQNGTTSQNTQKLDMKQYNSTYTPEQNSAYQFAKSNGITTTSSIKEAKMNTPLTRIEMAKMLSQYAMNVLGQTPDASRGIVKFKDVSNKMNTQYDNGVTLAYQLGIMGINMPNNEFRPNDTVTRAEFATALSRMIYGTEDGTGRVRYYEPHIAKLYNEGIINNANPNMKELRGYVMTMLMRSVK